MISWIPMFLRRWTLSSIAKRNVGPVRDLLLETAVANSKPKVPVGQFQDAWEWRAGTVPSTAWLVFSTSARLLNSISGCTSRWVNYGGGRPQMRCHCPGFAKALLSSPPRPTVVNMPWLLKQMPSLLWRRVSMSWFFKNIALPPSKTYQVMPKYKFPSLDRDFQKMH